MKYLIIGSRYIACKLIFNIAALSAVIILALTACGRLTGGGTVTVTGIVVTDALTVYLTGSTFNKNGIRVTAAYSDGTTKVIKDYTVTGFDSAHVGEQTLTAHYEDKTASWTITVVEHGFIETEEVSGGAWFTMGDNEGNENEKPVRQVIITCIYMGKYPVTQAEYQEVMGTNPSSNSGVGKDNFPVETASWYDAVEFCNKLSEKDNLEPAYNIDKDNPDPNNDNDYDAIKWTVTMIPGANGYRLPTEAEWEYACRAGTTTRYSTGNTITGEQANYNSAGTTAAGGFNSNPLGLCDMHGNVWEWCWDWYVENQYGNTPNRVGNPPGPAAGVNRVRRGGSWKSADAGELRSAYRESAGPDTAADDLGFRVLRPKYPEGV